MYVERRSFFAETLPHCQVDVVELEPAVIHAAKQARRELGLVSPTAQQISTKRIKYTYITLNFYDMLS